MNKRARDLFYLGILLSTVICNYIGLVDFFSLPFVNAREAQPIFVNFVKRVRVDVGYQVILAGNRGYVSNNDGITIIDLENPKEAHKIGFVEEDTNGFDVHNELLFRTEQSGLVIYNVSSPNNPLSIGFANTNRAAYNTKLNDSLVFTALYNGQMDVYNVSDLENPEFISTYFGSGRGLDLAVCGTTIYYADPDQGLEVINVTDPSDPHRIRTVSNTYGAWDLYRNNELLYLGCHGLGLKVLDISDPTNPTVINQFNDGGEIYGVCGNDSYLFLGDLQEGLEVLTYSNSSYLSEIASYEATPHDIAFNDNYIYLADQDRGFLVLELSREEKNNSNYYYLFFLIIPIIGITWVGYYLVNRKRNQ
ncbi:MAG: hypothetical protein GF308_09125 [Candidatus Heimdallarchaeota archaeon]|nr:hypothetical protein [Candidatus Heimdallarchaeota archaeon]